MSRWLTETDINYFLSLGTYLFIYARYSEQGYQYLIQYCVGIKGLGISRECGEYNSVKWIHFSHIVDGHNLGTMKRVFKLKLSAYFEIIINEYMGSYHGQSTYRYHGCGLVVYV